MYIECHAYVDNDYRFFFLKNLQFSFPSLNASLTSPVFIRSARGNNLLIFGNQNHHLVRPSVPFLAEESEREPSQERWPPPPFSCSSHHPFSLNIAAVLLLDLALHMLYPCSFLVPYWLTYHHMLVYVNHDEGGIFLLINPLFLLSSLRIRNVPTLDSANV